ncbi:MAG: DNA polymerase III subunit delta [Clostridia bacterium]|nr:DNA polymerase III subunit delta [Clostridia bacterium]
MPDIKMIDLERQLKADKPSCVYLVYGNEGYLKRTAVERLLDCCIPEMMAEFNFQRFDGVRCEVREITDAVGQFPMMAERKCVLVEDLDITKCSAEDFALLSDCIMDAPSHCVLILWQNDVELSEKNSRGGKFVSLCKNKGSVLKLDVPRTSELARMLCDRASGIGGKLAMSEAYHLIERCGNDITRLYSELDKLALYAGRKSISKDMIDEICPPSLEADVFKISRYILAGNSDDAFGVTEKLIAQKVEPIEIFMQLCGNFIDLYRANAASRAGLDEKSLAEAFPSDYKGREFRIRNAMRDQSSHSQVQLRRYIDLLYDTELKLKRGRIDRKTCLEQLISNLCTQGRGRSGR